MLISKSIHEEVSVILLPKHPVLVCYAAILYHTGKKKILPQMYTVHFLLPGIFIWESQQIPCSENREMCYAWKEKFYMNKASLGNICQ